VPEEIFSTWNPLKTKGSHEVMLKMGQDFTQHSVIRSTKERPGPGCKGPPSFGKGSHPIKARRRITDVVNRSEAEIDTPEECPEGKVKPQSNGHGRRRRDSLARFEIWPDRQEAGPRGKLSHQTAWERNSSMVEGIPLTCLSNETV